VGPGSIVGVNVAEVAETVAAGIVEVGMAGDASAPPRVAVAVGC
jgi:hypothetical protein